MIKRLLFVLIASVAAFAQGGEVIGVAQGNVNGYAKLLSAATVQICSYTGTVACDVPLTTYSDEALLLSNGTSVTSDASGNYNFFITPGSYVVKVSKTGYSTSLQKVTVGLTKSYLLPGTLTLNKLPKANSNGVLIDSKFGDDGSTPTYNSVQLVTTSNLFTPTAYYVGSPSAAISPADGQTWYVGLDSGTGTATEAVQRFTPLIGGLGTYIVGYSLHVTVGGTLGTTENVTAYVAYDAACNGSVTKVGSTTFSMNVANQLVVSPSFTPVQIATSASCISIGIDGPTWATNPTSVNIVGYILVR